MEVLTRSSTPMKDVFYRKYRGEFRLATRIVICDSRFKADDLSGDVAHKINCIALHLAYINKCFDLQIPSKVLSSDYFDCIEVWSKPLRYSKPPIIFALLDEALKYWPAIYEKLRCRYDYSFVPHSRPTEPINLFFNSGISVDSVVKMIDEAKALQTPVH